MNLERKDIPTNSSYEIFDHIDLPNQLTEIVQPMWSSATIQPFGKDSYIEDKNKNPQYFKGFIIEQTSGTSIETTPNMRGVQIAVILSLKDKDSLWVLSTKEPIEVKLHTKSFDKKLKSAILRQMQHPTTVKYHGFGDKQQITPFETGNFPFSTKK